MGPASDREWVGEKVEGARWLPAAVSITLTALLLGGASPPADAQSLRGSPASLDRQNTQARAHDFTYLRTPEDVRRFIDLGYLVHLPGNADYRTHNVSFPYARPEVRLFIERLARQYRGACGERLVVTSATRPTSNQPPNASSRSVHPTGMAIDLRVSQRAQCRNWLESTLLSLESRGLVEAIRERHPPHYHVAIYPQPYARYVARVTGDRQVVQAVADEGPRVVVEYREHRVRRGETLTAIASRNGTTVSRLRAENGLRGDRIVAGQTLRIPVERTVAASEAGGSGEARNHRVQRGESLWTIARRHGTTVQRIRAANGLSTTRIVPGQELTIPGGGSTAGSATSMVEHTVRPGESLWTIARQHGVTVERIRSENGIRRDVIQAGQVLSVPLDTR